MGQILARSLPLARTGIVAGTALALMEALADFGTVSYFAVNTFTTGIYRAWLSLGDSVAAGQLATCLLVFVLAMLALERRHRGGARYAGKRTPIPPQLFAAPRHWALSPMRYSGRFRFLGAGGDAAKAGLPTRRRSLAPASTAW